MHMNKVFAWILTAAFSLTLAWAQPATKKSDEGMWLPLKLKELNYPDMKAKGLQLAAEQVYSETDPSLKDAVVRMGQGFCTGEVISSEGLVLTNHHCGYDAIAGESSTENDYLTDGFWAMSRDKELPINGLTVSFLVRSEDVTRRVLDASNNGEDEGALESIINEIETAAAEDGKYQADVKEMFHGSEYYLFVYKTYRDVRLVGAPPSSIGKYGGDTDNWMWPRHTGDFTLFRIYAGADNEPADYSESNKAYTPRHFFPISLGGIDAGDYAMVMGYPGSTERYLPAAAVELNVTQSNTDKYRLMGQKLEIQKKYMDADDATRIALASDYASLSNYWKYLIGQTEMLKRYDIADIKRQEEAAFKSWANADPTRKAEYGDVISKIDELYANHKEADRLFSYINFGFFAPKVAGVAVNFFRMKSTIEAKAGDKEAPAQVASMMGPRIQAAMSDFNPEMDKEILVATMSTFLNQMPKEQYPQAVNDLLASKAAKKGKTPEEKLRLWADWAFNTSLATSPARTEAFLKAPNLKTLNSDPLVSYYSGVISYFRSEVAPQAGMFEANLNPLLRKFEQGMRDMYPNKKFYPDANSSMRFTFGEVKPYYPRDGVFYDYFTTLDGVFEKEDPGSDEFTVPGRLKTLWQQKDFGPYALSDGRLPVNFLSTNDITGGNSGSPVINSRGELIGTAFDGNWEAMAGDIYVFPQYNRTISCDIRYTLFIIDKFAGAGHLLKEMKIVNAPK